MNSKDIENKIKRLYKNVEPDHNLADDQRILRYEKQAMEFSERYHNDPEFKKTIQSAHAKRGDEWRANVTANAKAIAEKHNDPEWRANWEENYYESRKRLKSDPEFKKMMAKRNKEMAKDPAWREAHLESRAPISDKNSDWYKNIKKANQIRAEKQKDTTTQEYKNMRKGREKMKNDPTWRLNMTKAKGGKPVSTPWGKIYMSPNEASRDSANHGESYSAKRIRIRCNKQTDGFKYITWEQYEKG